MDCHRRRRKLRCTADRRDFPGGHHRTLPATRGIALPRLTRMGRAATFAMNGRAFPARGTDSRAASGIRRPARHQGRGQYKGKELAKSQAHSNRSYSMPQNCAGQQLNLHPPNPPRNLWLAGIRAPRRREAQRQAPQIIARVIGRLALVLHGAQQFPHRSVKPAGKPRTAQPR